MQLNLFLLLALFTLAVGCSQQSTKTSIKVSTAALFGGSAATQGVSQGGLMVWGKSDKGDSFSRALNNTDTLSIELPNGKWTFAAVAWENATNNKLESNNVRCSVQSNVTLAGDAIAPIGLNLLTTTCDTNPLFKANGGIIEADLMLRVCRSTSGITGVPNECHYDRSAADWKSYPAPVRAMRVRLPEFDNFKGSYKAQGEGLVSACGEFDTATGQWNGPTDIALPLGLPNQLTASFFRTELEIFWNDFECMGTNTTTLSFAGGLAAEGGTTKYSTLAAETQNLITVQYTDEQFCKDKGELTTFPGGTGTYQHPYTICSARQLYKMHESGMEAMSFRLMADVNLNPYSKHIATATMVGSWPANASTCWNIGQNWQPVGSAYDAGCNYTLSNNFSGSIYGGDHVIKGVRMRPEDEDAVGFIGSWVPTNRSIQDLVFEKPEIGGNSRVGVVAGLVQGNVAYMSNITIKDGDIEARSGSNARVGALVGEAGDPTVPNDGNLHLNNIKIISTHVNGEGSYVGGVVGLMNKSPNLTNIFSRTTIWHNGGYYVGGLFGGIEGDAGTATYHSWSHEGAIHSNGQDIGGLVGIYKANDQVSDAYAVTAITAESQASNRVGGLFGRTSVAFNLARAYFAGHIYDNCISTCDRGRVIGRVDAPTTTQDVLVVTDDLLLIAGQGDSNGVSPNSYENRLGLALTAGNGIGNFVSPGRWVQPVGGWPRLIKEQHICGLATNLQTLASQGAAPLSRGSASNPLIVCRKEQLMEIATLSSGKFVKLAGAVSLTDDEVGTTVADGAYTPPSIPTGVTLDGKDALLFGYDRSLMMPSTSQNMSIFATNNGTIKNLTVANTRMSVMLASASINMSGLVGNNFGTIDRLYYFSGSMTHNATSLVSIYGVAVNNQSAAAKITNFDLQFNLGGPNRVFGVVGTNVGRISQGTMYGSFNTGGHNGAVTNIAAIAETNNGTIESIQNGTSFDYFNGTAPQANSNISMGVLTNTGSTAVLQDIEITSEARWQLPGFDSNIAQIAVTNASGAKIFRTVMNGELTDQWSNSSSNINASNGQPVYANSATVSGLVTSVPTGRKIAQVSGINISCSANIIAIPDITIWDDGFNEASGYWDSLDGFGNNDLIQQDRYIWVVFENNGDRNIFKASGSNLQATNELTLDLDGSCVGLDTSGSNVSFIQSYANNEALAYGNVSNAANNFSGFVAPQNLDKATLVPSTNSPWNTKVLDFADATDLTTIMNYYVSVLSGNQPSPPAPWAIEDGRLELFGVDD